ncbi:hypothetical protein FIV03_30005 (plasmid) [Labrenzia sp. THAF187b]|nr:hypothetical protein FIV03_30005 [Labrenzia sp. THAF187b]
MFSEAAGRSFGKGDVRDVKGIWRQLREGEGLGKNQRDFLAIANRIGSAQRTAAAQVEFHLSVVRHFIAHHCRGMTHHRFTRHAGVGRNMFSRSHHRLVRRCKPGKQQGNREQDRRGQSAEVMHGSGHVARYNPVQHNYKCLIGAYEHAFEGRLINFRS